jgi:hypothetical protein
MSQQTFYFSCGFKPGRGASLKADVPKPAKTGPEAVRSAERMANLRVGAAAYSVDGDPETNDFDEIVVLFRAGRVPPEFE